MKYLIIGASGFVGRHILSYVKSFGYESIGTSSKKSNSNLVTFDLIEHNIKDCIPKQFFERDKDIYGIICAAITPIDRCAVEKDLSRKVNVEKTIKLIEDLKELKVKQVFISTGSVFDGTSGYYKEDEKYSPICEYGRHKVEVEQYIRKNLPESLILRLDKIIGDDPSEQHLFTEWYRSIKKQTPIICIENQLFSPTLVDDVARAIELSCKQLSGIYNIANPEFFLRSELAAQFVRAIGCDATIICKKQKELNLVDPRPEKSYLDSTKFIKSTGMYFTSMSECINNFIKKVKK